MLKKFILGFKEIPIPIPIRNLGEFVKWLESTLVKEGSVITNLSLDSVQYVDSLHNLDLLSQQALSDVARVQVNIDSPRTLSVQTLDAIRDLSDVIQKKMQQLGVEYWTYEGQKPGVQLEEICNDMKLMLELIDHVNGITNYAHENLAAVNGLFILISRCYQNLCRAVSEGSWKEVASILVNRLDYYLKELVSESENLQIILLTQDSKNLYTELG